MSKDYTGKWDPTLVYSSLIKAAAEVRQHGVERYDSSEDWRGVPLEEWLAALLRHTIALCVDGEELDPDLKANGLPHAYFIVGNIQYIIEKLYGKPHAGITKHKNGTKELKFMPKPAHLLQLELDL